MYRRPRVLSDCLPLHVVACEMGEGNPRSPSGQREAQQTQPQNQDCHEGSAAGCLPSLRLKCKFLKSFWKKLYCSSLLFLLCFVFSWRNGAVLLAGTFETSWHIYERTLRISKRWEARIFLVGLLEPRKCGCCSSRFLDLFVCFVLFYT